MTPRAHFLPPSTFRIGLCLLVVSTLWAAPVAAEPDQAASDRASARTPGRGTWPLDGLSETDLNPAQGFLNVDAEPPLPERPSVGPPDGLFSGPGAEPSAFGSTSAGWLENLSFFGGLDGSKQPQDLGVNANLGGRLALNWGTPLVEDWGLGAQVGVAYAFSDAAVQVLPRLEGTDERNQYYLTLGVFERTEFGLNVSFGYDFLWEDYYDRFQFGQWRGRVVTS